MTEPKKRIRCPECGSEDITSDALARWCVETQKWEHSSLLDNMDCNECGYKSSNESRFREEITAERAEAAQ